MMNEPLALPIDEQQIIAWRRYLHQHPETSGEEAATAAYLAQELLAMGLQVEQHIAGHGIVATLVGDAAKKCVALRADMDALPIQEETGAVYHSLNAGVMHACGHDVHMSTVLGVAKALTAVPHTGGTIKFIFQPREEKPPGGAKYMVEAGVMENPRVDAILGFHVSPNFEVGSIGIKEGTIMAVADDFCLRINGRGGHGSQPNTTIDSVVVAAEVVVALQTVVSRMYAPMEPLVITIGTIHGGTAQNIIPDMVEMTGTLRCLSNETRDKALAFMHRILHGVTEAWGASYELDYLYGYPPVVNDGALVDAVCKTGVSYCPSLKIVEMPHSLLAGEDYSYYGKCAPSVYFMLGGAGNVEMHPWHHRLFDIDERCLPIGATILAETARKLAEELK